VCLQEEARAAASTAAELRQTSAAAEARAAAARHEASVLQQRLAAAFDRLQQAAATQLPSPNTSCTTPPGPTAQCPAAPLDRLQRSPQSSPVHRASADGLAVSIEDPLAVMRAIESLRQAVATKDNELTHSRQQLDTAAEEQCSLQSLVSELREQNTALRSSAEVQCSDDVAALDARLAESRRRSDEGAEASRLRGVVLAKEREIEMLRAQLELTGSHETSPSWHMRAADGSTCDTATEVARLQRAVVVKDRHIEALRREVEELGRMVVAEDSADVSNDIESLQRMAAKAESLQQALAAKDGEIEGLCRDAAHAAKAEVLQLEGLLAAKDVELAGLRERLEADKGVSEEPAAAALEAQVRRLEEVLLEAEAERRTLQRKVAELQGELVLVTVERDGLAATKSPPTLTVEVRLCLVCALYWWCCATSMMPRMFHMHAKNACGKPPLLLASQCQECVVCLASVLSLFLLRRSAGFICIGSQHGDMVRRHLV
jgi:hypothetical protein